MWSEPPYLDTQLPYCLPFPIQQWKWARNHHVVPQCCLDRPLSQAPFESASWLVKHESSTSTDHIHQSIIWNCQRGKPVLNLQIPCFIRLYRLFPYSKPIISGHTTHASSRHTQTIIHILDYSIYPSLSPVSPAQNYQNSYFPVSCTFCPYQSSNGPWVTAAPPKT